MSRALRNSVVLAAVLVLAGTACEDPVGPSVTADDFTLELRDVYQYTGNVLDSAYVEFEAVLADSVSSTEVDSIAAMEVLWPNGATRMPIPVQFHTRSDGLLGATTRVPREKGLFNGTYHLTITFADGREVVLERSYSTSARVDRPTDVTFQKNGSSVYLSWRGPNRDHEWSTRIERWLPEPVDTLVAGPNSHGRGGAYTVGMTYGFEAGVTYAVILEVGNEYTKRVVATTFVGP